MFFLYFNSFFFQVLAFIRAFLFAFGGIKAAKYFHKKLLNTILKAPIPFFDVTPVRFYFVFLFFFFNLEDSN